MKYVEIDGIRFEKMPIPQLIKKYLIVNPMINFVMPKKMLFYIFRKSKSPLAKELMVDPGGWKSMKICYENADHVDYVDKMVLKFGTFPMGLRNRKKMVVKCLSELINKYKKKGAVNVLGIGSGPGDNVIGAMLACQGHEDVYARLIDTNVNALFYGEKLKSKYNLGDKVRYIEADARDLKNCITVSPQIVKLIGIIEYLTDDELNGLFKLLSEEIAEGGSIITHGISNKHGHSRFMKRIFGFSLNYRIPEKVIGMLEDVGFGKFKVYREPLGIYSIITCEKKKV